MLCRYKMMFSVKLVPFEIAICWHFPLLGRHIIVWILRSEILPITNSRSYHNKWLSVNFSYVFPVQVLPISSTEDLCHGLLFVADSTCGQFFPTFPICDESRVSSVISSCSDTDIIMSANSTHSLRFWLSYYGTYKAVTWLISLQNIFVCKLRLS